LTFAPVNTVGLTDLEIAEVDNNDLIGHKVTINKSDYSQVRGRVIKVSEQKTELNLSVAVKGVETNVFVTVVDNDGIEHLGTLFIDQE
jgi:transcription antitermination factor NusG